MAFCLWHLITIWFFFAASLGTLRPYYHEQSWQVHSILYTLQQQLSTFQTNWFFNIATLCVLLSLSWGEGIMYAYMYGWGAPFRWETTSSKIGMSKQRRRRSTLPSLSKGLWFVRSRFCIASQSSFPDIIRWIVGRSPSCGPIWYICI